MEPIPLPPPFKGINQDIPIIAVQSPQCEMLYNFNVIDSGVSVRHGDAKYNSFTAVPNTDNISWDCLTNYGNDNVYACIYNNGPGKNRMEIYNVDTGLLSYNFGAFTGNNPIYPFYFNGYLFFFCPDAIIAPGIVFNGAAFVAITYTVATPPFYPRGGGVYKNRAYIINGDTRTAYWYSNIDAIGGPLTAVNLGSIIKDKATLEIITPITLADNISAITLLAFVFSSGEVLFYSGTYPNATDWTLAGRATIGIPFDRNASIPYQGDCLVLTDAGVFSLRDLFLKGSQNAANLILSAPIKATWLSIVKNYRGASFSTIRGVQGVFDSTNSRIIIMFPQHLDATGANVKNNYFLIYDTDMQAWYIHENAPITVLNSTLPAGLISFKDKILFGSIGSLTILTVSTKEGRSDFQDYGMANTGALTSYDYEIVSAAVANGRSYVQRAGGIDVILESDMYPTTEYTFVKDFGVQETTPQLIPTQASTLQKPTANMGIEGSFIQYKISGTTAASKTVGYNLYGTNIWIENGSRPR